MQITVSESAIRQLRDMGLDEGKFLRLGVKPGGCAGMSYSAVLDENETENDETVYENGPVRVLAHTRFLPLLDGLSIDYSADLIRPGFVLKNPNVQESCGCGSSFKTDDAACQDCPA